MKVKIGSQVDHNMDQYRFARTCPGFVPERERAWGDIAVAAACVLITIFIAATIFVR